MRWKRRLPKDGDYRIRRKFALIPVQLDNGQMCWWEVYEERQRYQHTFRGGTTWVTQNRLPIE